MRQAVGERSVCLVWWVSRRQTRLRTVFTAELCRPCLSAPSCMRLLLPCIPAGINPTTCIASMSERSAAAVAAAAPAAVVGLRVESLTLYTLSTDATAASAFGKELASGNKPWLQQAYPGSAVVAGSVHVEPPPAPASSSPPPPGREPNPQPSVSLRPLIHGGAS